MADRDDLVAQFCAITSAGADVASQYLEMHDWDLDAATDFYFEHGPPAGGGGGGGGGGFGRGSAQ